MSPRSSTDRELVPGGRSLVVGGRSITQVRNGLATPPPWPPPVIPPTPEGNYPAIGPLVYTAQPSLAVPSILEVKTDPTWGTEITRVNTLSGQRHAYSSAFAWSRFQKWLMLNYPPGGSGSDRSLHDGMTLELIDQQASPPANLRWSTVDDDLGWGYANPNIFRRAHPTMTGWVVDESYTLSQFSSINYNGGSGTQSLDDRYHPLQVKWSNGNYGVAIFDTVTETIVVSRVFGNSSFAISNLIDNSCMSFDGNWIIVQFEPYEAGVSGSTDPNAQGTWRYDRATMLNGLRLTTHVSHAAPQQLADGTQVWVQASMSANGAGSGSHLGYHRIATGAYTSLHSGQANLHISGTNFLVPGYIGVSTFSSSGTQPGIRTAFALELATGLVRTYAHTHKGSGSGYAYETHAVWSPDMERVGFASDWDGGPIGFFVAGKDVIRPSIIP